MGILYENKSVKAFKLKRRSRKNYLKISLTLFIILMIGKEKIAYY